MKLLDHLPHGTVTAIAILAGVFLIYESGALNKAVSIAENAANRNSENVLHEKVPFIKKIADKDKEISKDKVVIADLEHNITDLANKYLSTQRDLATAKTPHDTIRIQKGLITELSAQNKVITQKCAVQDTIINTCTQQKVLLQARVDTLEVTLMNQYESSKCHILFLGCPSRIASFEAGGLMGLITGIIVTSIHIR